MMQRTFSLLILPLTLVACSGLDAKQVAQDAPFAVSEMARFNEPWAMTFLSGRGVEMTNVALITEKAGRLFLIDTMTGKKTLITGTPTVTDRGQGGLGDVIAHPRRRGQI